MAIAGGAKFRIQGFRPLCWSLSSGLTLSELRATMKGRIHPVSSGLGTAAQVGHSTIPEGAIHTDHAVNGASWSHEMHQPWISQCFSHLSPAW